MKSVAINALAAALLASSTGTSSASSASTANPVSKVLDLLASVEAKVIADGEAEQKAFEEYVDFCKNGAKDKEFEMTTAKSEIEDLTATIAKAKADTVAESDKIEELAGAISTNEADLKAAAGLREKEHEEFVAAEKELVDSVDTLTRALNVLERKLRGAALLQAKVDSKDVQTLIHTIEQVVDAAALSLHDKNKLVALAQSGAGEEDEDSEDEEELSAPAAAAYKSHSSGILDVLEDLRQKAEVELQSLRREETNALHSYELTKQSLDDQIKVDKKGLSDSKTRMAEAKEIQAVAEGDLSVTEKELSEAQNTLKNMKSGCMRVATDHEASVKSRAEELEAIRTAEKVLKDMTAGAVEQTYSLLQTQQAETTGSGLRTRTDLVNFEVVNILRKLAKEQRSPALAQLAGRISVAVRTSAQTGEDPFAKVKDMISNMITKLQEDAASDASHKAYCDKEYSETKQKIDELEYDIEKYSTKKDKASSQSAKLKDEVATLHKTLLEVTKSQAEADKLRKEEHDTYVAAKKDLEQGLEGVRMALQVLRDYYANKEDGGAASAASLVQQMQPAMPTTHSSSSGSGGGIIGMLEVIEGDMGKNLAGIEMEEMTAATEYERLSMDNKISKTSMEQDVKYKTKEAASLDKAIVELASDLDAAQTELASVRDYSTSIRNMCEQKPESYTERKARREAEVAGLKEALKALEGRGLAFLQRHRHHGMKHHSVLSHRIY